MNRDINNFTRPYLERPKHGLYLRDMGDHRYAFWCPACNSYHTITIDHPDSPPGNPSWTCRDHMSDRFTVEPSVRVSTRRQKKDAEGNPIGDEKEDVTLCHLNITEGKLVYHSDSPQEGFTSSAVVMDEEPEAIAEEAGE